MKKLLIITILFSFIVQKNAKADLRENAKFYNSTIKKINTPKKFSINCLNQIKEAKECSYLFSLFERDQSTGMFFGMISDSPWDSCKKYITQSKNISTQELENRYSRDDRTSLGIRSNFFSTKMNECLNSKSEQETQEKIIVSMGYDYLNRINQSTNKLTNEIKSINNILGDPIEKNIPCDEFNFPNDKKICTDIKNQNCLSKNELETFSKQIFETAIEPIIALNKKLRALRSQTFGRGGVPKFIRDEIKKVENSIVLIEEQNPIIKGKTLRPFIESLSSSELSVDNNKLQNTIKSQLIENRKALSDKINENIDMNNCLLNGEERYCKKFNDNSKRLPPHQDIMFFEKGNLTDQQKKINYTTSEFYNATQCMDNFRGLKNEFNEFATDFSVNVGLTLLSGGVGALAKIGQGAKIAIYSERAMMVIDAGFLGTGVKEAAENCSNELNKLELKNTDSLKSVCPISQSSPESIVVANYQSCVTGAILSSLNALPFVPIAVSKYLARSKSQKSIIENLSADTQKLISFKGPRKAMDPYDLKKTGTILPAGKIQNVQKVFERDGVYVFIIDEKGNMVISHRAPDLNAGTKDTNQFLGTHRGLYSKLLESGESTVVAAGEIRVIGGRPISVSPRAGSFHNTPEDILISLKAASSEEQKAIDSLLAEYKTAPKDDPFHMEDFVDAHPKLKAIFEEVQKKLKELNDKRMDIVKNSMEEKKLIPKESNVNFNTNVSGDAHIEGKAAAIAEIECSKNKSCAGQIVALKESARKFLEKYKTPKEAVDTIFLKYKNVDDVLKLSERERAYQFFQRRSELLLKEGPIEFLQNSRPESYGLKMENAMKYFDDWAKQF
jgi:hypothetical protein